MGGRGGFAPPAARPHLSPSITPLHSGNKYYTLVFIIVWFYVSIFSKCREYVVGIFKDYPCWFAFLPTKCFCSNVHM